MLHTHISTSSAWMSSVSWKPAEEYSVASGSHDHQVAIWDIRSLRPLHVLSVHDDNVLAVLWTPTYLLSGGADNTLRIHALSTA
jgi:WD40 repeat protein